MESVEKFEAKRVITWITFRGSIRIKDWCLIRTVEVEGRKEMGGKSRNSKSQDLQTA